MADAHWPIGASGQWALTIVAVYGKPYSYIRSRRRATVLMVPRVRLSLAVAVVMMVPFAAAEERVSIEASGAAGKQKKLNAGPLHMWPWSTEGLPLCVHFWRKGMQPMLLTVRERRRFTSPPPLVTARLRRCSWRMLITHPFQTLRDTHLVT